MKKILSLVLTICVFGLTFAVSNTSNQIEKVKPVATTVVKYTKNGSVHYLFLTGVYDCESLTSAYSQSICGCTNMSCEVYY